MAARALNAQIRDDHGGLGGATNDDALRAVKKKFPQAATSMASIAWCRSRLRKDYPNHPNLLTDREAREKKGEKS